MKNLTCLRRNQCNEDNCDDGVVTCNANQLCISMIRFKENNFSSPEIQFANCFEDSKCKYLNTSFCIVEYGASYRDEYCCCNQPMCNKNLKFIPKLLENSTSTSTYKIPAQTSSYAKHTFGFELTPITIAILVFSILLILALILILVILVRKRLKNRKRKCEKERNLSAEKALMNT